MFQTGGNIRIAKPSAGRGADHLRLHEELLKVRELRRAGKLDEAESICETLIAESPDFVGALQSLGWIHYAKRRYEQALACFVKANLHNPDNHQTLTFLATIYLKLGAREVAAQTLERALQLKPEDTSVQQTLGNIYREENEYELAARCYEKALNLDPNYHKAAEGLAKSYMHLGRLEEAAGMLERAFKLGPHSHMILHSMSLLPPALVTIDLLPALRECRKPEIESQSEFDNTNHFTMAAALDKKGRHEQAWQMLVKANDQINAKSAPLYRRQREKQELSLRRAEAFIPHPQISEPQTDSVLSLFIMGPSRSGKSTIELLASSIDGVKRGHECRIVDNAAARAAQNAGFPTVRRAASLLAAVEPIFLEAYLSELERRASGAAIFATTHPSVIHDVGRLSYILPRVRFVFVKRNIDDVALRIFMKKYNSGNHYGYDLRNIRSHVTWYYRMADIWAQKLPSLALCLNYEDAIADPQRARTQIAALLGRAAPDNAVPPLGDDRGCAQPYKAFMDGELAR